MVEKNNDITYYRATINNRSNLICRYHPLPLLPEGGDYWLHLFNYYSFLALLAIGKTHSFRDTKTMLLCYQSNAFVSVEQ